MIAKILHKRIESMTDEEIKKRMNGYIRIYPNDFMRLLTLTSEVTQALNDKAEKANGE